jgi:hypothetical protein
VVNDIDPTKVKFNWPRETETFREPWKRTTTLGVTSLTGFSVIIPEQIIKNYSKDDLKALYKEGKVLGQRTLKIKTQQDDTSGEEDVGIAKES